MLIPPCFPEPNPPSRASLQTDGKDAGWNMALAGLLRRVDSSTKFPGFPTVRVPPGPVQAPAVLSEWIQAGHQHRGSSRAMHSLNLGSGPHLMPASAL